MILFGWYFTFCRDRRLQCSFAYQLHKYVSIPQKQNKCVAHENMKSQPVLSILSITRELVLDCHVALHQSCQSCFGNWMPGGAKAWWMATYRCVETSWSRMIYFLWTRCHYPQIASMESMFFSPFLTSLYVWIFSKSQATDNLDRDNLDKNWWPWQIRHFFSQKVRAVLDRLQIWLYPSSTKIRVPF